MNSFLLLTDQATLQERKRDSIKAAEKHKVKEELKQEAKAKATKQTKHGRDGAGTDRDIGGEEGGEAADEAEAAKAKRSRWVVYASIAVSCSPVYFRSAHLQFSAFPLPNLRSWWAYFSTGLLMFRTEPIVAKCGISLGVTLSMVCFELFIDLADGETFFFGCHPRRGRVGALDAVRSRMYTHHVHIRVFCALECTTLT